MAWHMGSPLSQTLFTSLYLEKLSYPVPATLEDARFDQSIKEETPKDWLVHEVLRAYCVGLLKTCDMVHRKIGVDQCYEVRSLEMALLPQCLRTFYS